MVHCKNFFVGDVIVVINTCLMAFFKDNLGEPAPER